MQSGYALRVPDGTSVHDLLRHARKLADLTVDEVARHLGVSTSTWEKTEAGARQPRNGELVAFAHLTGQEPSVFGASSSPDGPPNLALLPGAVKGAAAD